MRKNAAARIILFCMIFVLICNGMAAAEGPEGRWKGSFSGIGKSGSASATFRSDGTCTLTALGISASGSYGDGKIKVSAYGHSMTLSYTYSGNRMTISGKMGAYSGKMVLKKQETDEGSGKDDKKNEALERLTLQLEAIKNMLQK